MDFAVLADNRITLKESKKRDKCLDLARELKKVWNKKVTMIPIVICVLSTISKGFVQGLEDLEMWKNEDINFTALLRSATIL